jgi:hypothetical protein
MIYQMINAFGVTTLTHELPKTIPFFIRHGECSVVAVCLSNRFLKFIFPRASTTCKIRPPTLPLAKANLGL